MSTLQMEKVSRWYGNVVAVNDVTMRIDLASPACSDPTGPASRR